MPSLQISVWVEETSFLASPITWPQSICFISWGSSSLEDKAYIQTDFSSL